jgi:hypothetical protein
MRKENKPVWAIKFRNFCFNNDLQAKDIAQMLHLRTATVYKYWAGLIAVPDDNKKALEQKAGLDIYEVFFNEEL